MICPVCKEEMPLLSRVCPVCGHTIDGDENHASASEAVTELESILFDIKALAEPTFSKSMGQLSVFMIPILTVIVFVMYVISSAGLFLILALLLAVWSVFLIVRKVKGSLGNSAADAELAELRNQYEYAARSLKRDYGKNREVANLLSEINEQIDSIVSRRKAMRTKNLMVWAAIFVVIILLASMGSVGVKHRVDENLATTWQEELDAYKYGEQGDEYDGELRCEIIDLVLAADEIAEAEAFFADYCAGLVGDLECATKIVRYHLTHDNKAGAETFINGCTLRYSSDINKLKKLIK
ncbi:MAG: hypothetical protein J6V55_03990 [Alistipes sp.]|nr:hypothetical protein [Alistipes sp.]